MIESWNDTTLSAFFRLPSLRCFLCGVYGLSTTSLPRVLWPGKLNDQKNDYTYKKTYWNRFVRPITKSQRLHSFVWATSSPSLLKNPRPSCWNWSECAHTINDLVLKMSIRHLFSPLLRRFCTSDNTEMSSTSANSSLSPDSDSLRGRKLARDQNFAESPASILEEIRRKQDESCRNTAMNTSSSRFEIIDPSPTTIEAGTEQLLDRTSKQHFTDLTKEVIMENQENMEPQDNSNRSSSDLRCHRTSSDPSCSGRSNHRIKSASASPPTSTRTSFQRRSERSIKQVESSPPLHSIALANRIRNRQNSEEVQQLQQQQQQQHEEDTTQQKALLFQPHLALKGRSKSAFIRTGSSPEALSKEDARKRMLSWRKTTKLRKTTSQQKDGTNTWGFFRKHVSDWQESSSIHPEHWHHPHSDLKSIVLP